MFELIETTRKPEGRYETLILSEVLLLKCSLNTIVPNMTGRPGFSASPAILYFSFQIRLFLCVLLRPLTNNIVWGKPPRGLRTTKAVYQLRRTSRISKRKSARVQRAARPVIFGRVVPSHTCATKSSRSSSKTSGLSSAAK